MECFWNVTATQIHRQNITSPQTVNYNLTHLTDKSVQLTKDNQQTFTKYYMYIIPTHNNDENNINNKSPTVGLECLRSYFHGKRPKIKVAVSKNLYNIHTFNGPLSGTTQVSRYQKGKTYLDFTETWQWHQLDHMQLCTLLQTDNHASTHRSVFTGQMPFLPPNQQHQSTEGTVQLEKNYKKLSRN